MSVEFPFTLQELKAVFPPEEAVPDELTDSYGDAITETEPFRGLKWPNVPSKLFRRNFEVPCSFSPQAFHYYFSALIWLTKTNLDDTITAADYAINLLRGRANDVRREWRQKRCSLFTRKQWITVKKWLNWLKVTPATVAHDTLDSALKTVDRYLQDTE